MAYRIEYKSSVTRDLKHLDKSVARKLIRDLETALSSNPHCGESLSGQFKGMFKLRIGDYRIVYSKTKEGVLILRIKHRSAVYER
ncbi:MAG: type II toxin-antitoxin system RelE/ParE family toxin [Methanotrichaceae archaeon]